MLPATLAALIWGPPSAKIGARSGNRVSLAAMPNAIVESVEPEETGQATGQNVVVRLVGSSIGAAVATARVHKTLEVEPLADRPRGRQQAVDLREIEGAPSCGHPPGTLLTAEGVV